MNKIFCIVLATLFFSLFSISVLAFETDNNWKYWVNNHNGGPPDDTNWYKINYDDTASKFIYNQQVSWQTISGDGTNPILTAGGGPVLFRKWIDWSREDLWFKAWDGYSGECFVNEVRIREQNFYLSKYLKPGKNLIACYIIGPGRDGIVSHFYGKFTAVSDSQIAWSNDWTEWYLTESPVNTGTEGKFYYCFNDKEHDYGCFWNSAWPWSSGAGTAFRKTINLETTENSYLLVGTNLLDGSLSNIDRFWCSVNGDQTNNVVGFSQNTHEKYNLKADISSKVKQGLNTITCWVSTYADPNSFPGGFKKFDMSFSQKSLDILGLKTSSVSIEDPTIAILVNGSGSATVYAELFENNITLGAVQDTVDLNGKTEVLLTLETPQIHSEPYWRVFRSHMYGQIEPSSEWYKLNYDDSSYVSRANNIEERWTTKTVGTEPIGATGSDESYFRTWVKWKGEDFSLNGWDGYFGECYINERKVTDRKIQLKNYLKHGNNLVACMIKGTGWESNNLMSYFYGNINPTPAYFNDISLSDFSVKITAVSDSGGSKTKDYNLEFTEPVPESVTVSNPFVQSGGGGSESSNTNSSGSVPIVPLAVGLTGAAAIGAGYLATRPGKKYGKPSLGPGERLKTFWDNTAKEEKYYNEVRVPEIKKRQAEIEAIIKGFEEQARKKKEAEELEKVREKVAWINKLTGAGKLSTVQAAKELKVLAGTAGIGYESYTALSNASKELETTLTVDTNKKNSPLDSAYKALTSFTDWAGGGINWGLDQIRDFVGWLFYSGKDFGNFSLDKLSGIPFIGGYLEDGIRVPWNLLEDNTRNLRNYIVGDTERLNSIADKLSIGGLGLVGAGTVSMMTGIGAPFAVPAMVAGAGMLVAGSVIDVSTWLSNESIRKADGWARLRGILGTLTFLPELGAAGKVSKVSKLTKLQGKELHTMVVAAEKLFRLPRGTPIWDVITPFGKPLKLAKYRKYLENASAITQLKTGVITLGKYVRDIYETLLHEVSHTQTRSIIDSLVSVGGKDKLERIYNYLVENLLITRGDRNLVEDILADKLSLKADYIKYSANIRNMIIERLSDWESLGKLSPKDEIVIAQIYVYAKSFLRDTTLTQKIETLLKFENKFIRKDIFSIYKKFKEIGDLADIAELSKKDITTIISGIFGSYIHKIRNLITKGRRDIEVEGDI